MVSAMLGSKLGSISLAGCLSMENEENDGQMTDVRIKMIKSWIYCILISSHNSRLLMYFLGRTVDSGPRLAALAHNYGKLLRSEWWCVRRGMVVVSAVWDVVNQQKVRTMVVCWKYPHHIRSRRSSRWCGIIGGPTSRTWRSMFISVGWFFIQ